MSLLERITPIKPATSLERHLHEGRMMIEPELAQRILSEANYQGQRKIDHRAVGVYAEMMRRGLWQVADPIAFGRLAGRLVLVNGQHRLHAIVAFGRPVEFRVAINDCETERDLRSLYYRYDTVMRIRTKPQILSAVGLAEEKGVGKGTARAVFSAINIIVNGFTTPSNHTRSAAALAKMSIVDLRMEACDPWWEPAKALEVALKRGQSEINNRIMRATTYAVALITMRYQPEKAEKFWRGVAENDGLKRGDPRHTFVRDLLSRNTAVGTNDQGIIATAHAWNAFYDGRQLHHIKVGSDHSLRIAGTPIGNRR